MGRPRKNQKQHQVRKNSAPASSTQDVTIHDSADATKPVGRPKKHNTIAVSPECEPEGDVDEPEALVGQRRRRLGGTPPDTGREYPEILFYLLSHYVLPEDVGRFAGINRAAYAITKCEGFWRGLFARHCERAARGLPARLDLARAPRLYGLRQRVVCALHHIYRPFLVISNHKLMRGVRESPTWLVGRRCVDIWYVKSVDSWLYYVKLKRAGADERTRAPAGGRGDDIDANPERDSCVMLVKCSELEQVPPAMGLLMSSAALSLGAHGGCRLRRLQLGFVRSSHLPPPAAAPTPDVVCVLNTVQETSVVRWWERHYPAFNCAPPPPGDEPLLRTEFALADDW